MNPYRALVRRSPRPSKQQMRNFALHVSEDHSWYKKLPFGGDGEPFFLYLSPHGHEASVEPGYESAETRCRWLGRWNYWNFGPPDQRREDAVASAVAGIRVPGDAGEPLDLPAEVLEHGLVYLRATVSPQLGPEEERFEEFRREAGGPSAPDDRRRQLAQMAAAMRRVVAWAYES